MDRNICSFEVKGEFMVLANTILLWFCDLQGQVALNAFAAKTCLELIRWDGMAYLCVKRVYYITQCLHFQWKEGVGCFSFL